MADSPGTSRRGPTHAASKAHVRRTPQQIGASNRRSGKHWQLACADWLREHGFPHASYEIRNGVGDVVGVGDINIECTLTGWDKIWIKEDQSAGDAKRRGFTDWCVWKKRRGKTDPGLGGVLVQADKFFALVADLQAYQRAETDWHLDHDKAFADGWRAHAAQMGETRDAG